MNTVYAIGYNDAGGVYHALPFERVEVEHDVFYVSDDGHTLYQNDLGLFEDPGEYERDWDDLVGVYCIGKDTRQHGLSYAGVLKWELMGMFEATPAEPRDPWFYLKRYRIKD